MLPDKHLRRKAHFVLKDFDGPHKFKKLNRRRIQGGSRTWWGLHGGICVGKDARLREWFKRIKRKRGSKIARVAVMRKLASVIWHMLSKRKTYDECRAFGTAYVLVRNSTGIDGPVFV